MEDAAARRLAASASGDKGETGIAILQKKAGIPRGREKIPAVPVETKIGLP
jgi:hypothetical protein